MTRLVLVNPNTNRETTEAMLRVARDAAPPGVEVAGLTATSGAPLILDEASLAAAAQAVADLAPQLRRAAPHGVIVSAFGDPGLPALRERACCPVTGIAEAGMAHAASGGRTFAVVTTTPGLVATIARTAERYGHAGLFRGTVLTAGDALDLMADPDRLAEALLAACREALGRLGVDALVVGGGPLATAARALSGTVPVPLIEPVPAALRLALRRLDQDRPLIR